MLLAHVLIGTSPPKANSDLPVCTDSAVLKAGISNKSGSVKFIGSKGLDTLNSNCSGAISRSYRLSHMYSVHEFFRGDGFSKRSKSTASSD
ncbi:hypothetical protein DV515_00013851 [Chloebia gouldiae]|uniref:Uncharacterized protein n=1 Tax=Chloebia gouldiae TaxID=44316 RepID=A0A3L8S145_CHLGU|nr:hypothetical protein DV515_00013851 [Chloebia gouldiae]